MTVRTTSSLQSGLLMITFAVLAATLSGSASAAAVRSGFDANSLARNDDGSVGSALPFTINFFGNSYSALFINNNGNVTFDSALGTFTPFPINTTNRVIIAPFFADVDTRGSGSGIVTYGSGTVDGRPAFGVNWVDVGYYSGHFDKLNSFQLVIIDRSDIDPGDFDFELNHDQIQWETGDASQGSGGLGGLSASRHDRIYLPLNREDDHEKASYFCLCSDVFRTDPFYSGGRWLRRRSR
jgi:hypothetical protein